MSQSNALKKKIVQHKEKINYDRIADLLRVPHRAMQKYIYICDLFDDADFVLIMVHFRSDLVENTVKFNSIFTVAERNAILACRGLTIMLQPLKLMCGSYPYTSIIPTDSVPEDGTFESAPIFLSEDNLPTGIISTTNKYNKYIIGAVLRAFMVEGFVFLASHKKLTLDGSKFGNSSSFKEMFFNAQNCFKNNEDLYPLFSFSEH